jgi:hypothetical protein
MRRFTLKQAAVATFLILCFSCTTISPFSEVAYQRATSLKVDALKVMTTATSQFADHKNEVESLRSDIDKAFEYAKGRPKNSISTEQWRILRDPDRNLLGGFLKRWETEGKLSKTFVDEEKQIVSDSFDTIIGLESGKIGGEQASAAAAKQ